MAGRDVNININGKDNFTPAANSVGRSASNLKGVLGGLNSPIGGGLTSLIGGVGLAGATTAAVSFGIKSAAAFETTNVAFKTMLKSGTAAKDLLSDISKFAASTPFEFTELTDASKKLLAFGVAAEDIVPTLRQIGDISSGIGAPIGEIAELYGKARVQGRLFQEDINQLTGRGIPIIQELAKQFGTTDDQVKKLVESGKVNFKNLETAFASMTTGGGQFTGLMAAQADTLAGKWSNLKDTAARLATELGGNLVPSLKNVIDTINFGLGGDMTGVPKLVGEQGGLFAAGIRDPQKLKAARAIGNQRDALAAGKRALLTEKDPAKRAQLQAQVDEMQARLADSKSTFRGLSDAEKAAREKYGSVLGGGLVGGLQGGANSLTGLLGGAFDAVKGGTEFGVGKLGNAANIAQLFNETRTPQEKFDNEMAKLRAQRGDIGDDLFNRKRRMLEDDLAATFDKNSPQAKEQRQRGLAPLTEARFLTSAPGYAADPATRAAQETANTSKEQLVVLRAMERKLQRQTRLGVL